MVSTTQGHSRNNFDALRLFAAFLVLFSHQFILTGRPEPTILDVHSFGGIGVLIFFSISGYLISESWKRNPKTVDFIKNRFLRIWPAFAVMVLLMAFVVGPIATTDSLREYFSQPQTYKYLRMLYFRMNYELPGVFDGNDFAQCVNCSIWTIPLELKWYGILLLLSLLGLTKKRLPFLICSSVFIGYMLFWYVPSLEKRAWMPEFGVYFTIGMLISNYKIAFAKYRSYLFLIAVVASFVAAYCNRPYAALACLIPIATISLGTASIRPLNSVGRYGDFSYGFYLYAFPVQQMLSWSGVGKVPFSFGLVLATMITLLFAVLSWHLIEAPSLKYKAYGRRAVLHGSALKNIERSEETALSSDVSLIT